MIYRKPVVYIPPYNYCDRCCDACTIDKSRCLLYQTEMDERLHREIDGLGEVSAEERVERIVEDAREVLRRVESQARELGIAPASAPRGLDETPPRPRPDDPIVEEGTLLARGIAAFVREHGATHPGEARLIRRCLPLLAPKLGRATQAPGDPVESADAILQAQVVHRVLVAMGQALETMRRRDPSLGDAMLDLLAFMQRLRVEIEARWLGMPCELLEPAGETVWWGPLRDITPTLKQFRR